MENHPIPQNVTGFQFKLIGNMTIKQFAFLATGVVFAWIFSVSPLPELIRFPFALFIGFIGFSLAFIPIDGRPFDTMVFYFIRALFTPNQFVFQKGTLKNAQLAYPSPITTQNLQSTTQQSQPTAPVMTPQPTSIPTPLPQKQNEEEKTTYDQLLVQLTQTKTDKNRLEQELASLKQILIQVQEQSDQKIPPLTQNQQTTLTIPNQTFQPAVKKIVITPGQKPTGLAIPDAPNILTGIVKDSRNNVLANILVEVKDKDGSPVRAFKTNALGQFASATSLLNGVYTLEFDDPLGKHKFDALEISMTGEIIGPIEAVSIDQREELRKALFNQ